MKRLLILLACCAFLSALNTSCVSNKNFILFGNKNNETIDSTKFFVPNKQEYRIQSNDIVYVNIRAQDELAAAYFNSSGGVGGNTVNQNLQQGLIGGNAFYVSGHSLDSEGRIKLPMIGYLKVLGLTVKEIKTIVEKEAKFYFDKAHVVVRLSGINYTILGEVLVPGQRVVFQNQLNIVEAIANAGDLSELANRAAIKLVRQYPEGYKIHLIDLTDVSVFNSPYFYIQPNDLIYVEPLRIRSLGRSTTGIEAFRDVVSLFAGIAGIIANIVLISNLRNQ